MTDTPEARILAIRTLNDAARTIAGVACRLCVTIGVQSLPADDRMAILKGVVAFDVELPPSEWSIDYESLDQGELLPVLGPLGWPSSSICRQRRAMCR